MNAKHLSIVIEKGDDEEIAGSISTDDFLLTTVANMEEEVIQNLKMLIADFIQHEGQESSSWKNVKVDDIEYSIEYDLTTLFQIFDALKISAVAKLAGINSGLMRQYASGTKNASAKQARKIEDAVRALGMRLTQVSIK
ncbi:hypothetical protein WBJ53_13815 [Spirosoma sp. SC4-14]|uniref:hypothetical protein n=1 Tax=Spirosoma sp. SC4-14 TaxID=3128900 RepID=UPI0030D2ABF7